MVNNRGIGQQAETKERHIAFDTWVMGRVTEVYIGLHMLVF